MVMCLLSVGLPVVYLCIMIFVGSLYIFQIANSTYELIMYQYLVHVLLQFDKYTTVKSVGEFLMAAALMADDIKQLYDMIRAGEGKYIIANNYLC